MMWKTLVKIGLIGTNRSKVSEDMILELQSMGIKESDPARMILKAAVTMSMMMKAGTIPSDFIEELPIAIKKSPTNICGKRAILYLNRILKGKNVLILSEFLITLKKYNKCLPPESLPLILDKAIKNPDIWQAVKPALGNRGHWLISQNPTWSILDYTPTLTDWENGSSDERTAFLEQQRSVDPTVALALLKETWVQENTSTRKKLLKAFRVGLSKEDDPFLSTLLKEKPKELRETASYLLSLIPDSSFNQRMVIRLKKLISVKKSAKQIALKITLPRGVDDTMIIDGIKASVQLYRSGNKASQFAQMINRLPLNYWHNLTGLQAIELLPLFIKNEYAYLLLNAMTDAAVHHKNNEWSKLILEKWLLQKDEKLWQEFAPVQLISVIDQASYNELTLSGFKDIKYLPAENTPLDFLLQQKEHNWDRNLSLTFFDRLKNWLKSSDAAHWGDWHIRKILSIASFRVPVDLYPKISRDWPEHLPVWGGWERDVSGCLATLELRYKMEKAIREG